MRRGEPGGRAHRRRARGDDRAADAPLVAFGRGGGAGRLPPLHAEGDLRAAARHCGHPRARRQVEHALPAPLRHRGAAHPRRRRFRPDPRVRHELPRGAGGAAMDRDARRHPLQRGDRERVPLPGIRARPAHAGGGDFPIRRDGRYARRAGACALAGPGPQPRDLQRGRVGAGARHAAALPHARRPRDRRGVHQGVHDPARRRSCCSP